MTIADRRQLWSWPSTERRGWRWRLTQWRTYGVFAGMSLLQLLVGLATDNRYVVYLHAALSVLFAALMLIGYRVSRPRVPWDRPGGR